MLRRGSVVLLLLLLAACAQPPVRDEVTLDFSGEEDTVVVTAETTFDLHPKTTEARARVESARAAALAGTDAWSARFARLEPDSERWTQQRNHGVLERVSRSATIRSADLQQAFSDSSITVNLLRGEGWSELTFYPGTSTRASREQQRQFNDELTSWSSAVARYFMAMHHLYAYMNVNPERARYLFAALLNEKGTDGAEPVVLEDEQPLIDAVVDAMEDVAKRMDDQEGRAASFAEETDLIFNPFPARVIVRVPGDVLASEGFNEKLIIEPIDLFAAIAKLEGRWISPDPLAALLRDQQPTSEALAEVPRHAEAVVNASEIATAIRAELARPKQYMVRWRD